MLLPRSGSACLTLRNPMDRSPAYCPLYPWGSPGMNTGVGCYFLPQGSS